MSLYHFTAAHMLKPILEQGLTRGHTPVVYKGKLHLLAGTQWLTTEKDFTQDWCATGALSNLPYDRNAFRLRIEIPRMHADKLVTWDKFYTGYMQPNDYEKVPYFDDRDNCNPDLWRLFVGDIHPLWIKAFHENREIYRAVKTA